jgi:cobaltochelatase CobS
MFFQITSENRHAARRLLTKYGHPSDVVRNMRNGQLGKTIYQDVQDGKIPMAEAATAVTAVVGEQQPTETPKSEATTSTEPQTVTIPSAAMHQPIIVVDDSLNVDTKSQQQPEVLGAANQMASILETLMRNAAPKAKSIDADEVKAIVAEMLKSADSGRVATIEIKVGGELKAKVDGQQHNMFEHVVKTVSTRVQGRRLHVWLVGPSGSGKSFLASQAAQACELKYYSTSAIQSKYDLIGFVSPTGAEATLRTPFREAFENGGLFAWDDIDASDPRAFVAFNEALSNGRFAFPDKVVNQHEDFVCVASANTWGQGATADYVGRNKIDGATLSRFVRIPVNYDEQLERDMVGNHGWSRFIQRVRAAVQKEGIKVLVTPRHTLQGVALLAAGLKREDVESYTVFAGLDADTVARLRRAV